MPHDCRGQKLEPGDEVIVRFTVADVFQSDTACNVNLHPIDVADCKDYFPSSITCNSRFVELVACPHDRAVQDLVFETSTTEVQ